jgi:hypothetical protein
LIKNQEMAYGWLCVGVAAALAVGLVLHQCGVQNTFALQAVVGVVGFSFGAVRGRERTTAPGRSRGEQMAQATHARPRAALIVAHPDDEAMFFGPLLRSLRHTHDVYVLCLCSGDYDG